MARTLLDFREDWFDGECGCFIERWHTTSMSNIDCYTVDGQLITVRAGQSNIETRRQSYQNRTERDEIIRYYRLVLGDKDAS